ncbi:hypothetical protein HDU96_007487 [Phlyctochytrium bullatum]|nr:hypothetical protein HDU96_007487 [Phlyctochytrium bullatum]
MGADLVRRLESVKAQEAEIMKNVEGWTPLDLKAPVRGIGKDGLKDPHQAEPVYHTSSYVRPTYVFLPSDSPHRVAPQWWRGSKMFLKNIPYHDSAAEADKVLELIRQSPTFLPGREEEFATLYDLLYKAIEERAGDCICLCFVRQSLMVQMSLEFLALGKQLHCDRQLKLYGRMLMKA